MGLFKNNEAKAILKLSKQRNLFISQYTSTTKHLFTGFHDDMGMSDDLFGDQDILDGLYLLHDSIVLYSQGTTINDAAKRVEAAKLLEFVQKARSGESNLSEDDARQSVINACTAYHSAIKQVKANNDGTTVPILSALKTIEPLAEFYGNVGSLNVMINLPIYEHDIFMSYKHYWAKNL